MPQAIRACSNDRCGGESAGRFCPRCGRRARRNRKRGPLVALLAASAVLLLVIFRATATPGGAAPRMMSAVPAQTSWTSARPVNVSTASLAGTLAVMTTDEARLSVVRSFARQPKTTPTRLGEIVAALPFFTTDESRLEAVRLLARDLDPNAATGDVSAVTVFFTTDEARASAVDAILRAARH